MYLLTELNFFGAEALSAARAQQFYLATLERCKISMMKLFCEYR